MSRYIDVHITAPSEEEGNLIANALVEKRVAACVHILSIRSFYYWEKILCNDSEVLLIAKTKDYLFRTHLIPLVKSLHSYEVTEILALPVIDGDPIYLQWIDEQIISEGEL